jgi:iron complex outermembrane receptor protein
MNTFFHFGASLSAILAGIIFSGLLLAQTATDHAIDTLHGPDHDHEVLEEIVVTATPLARDIIEMSQSTTVLRGGALEREVANNIGDTLSRIPGLSNASFGQNVGRPVIRGLQGARVGVLNNNMTVSDASAVSQDHSVSVEPFLADQIEVLKGPATLIYGSGSIGGVVNIVTNTIPQKALEETFEGRAMVQGDTASNQKFAVARVDFGVSSLVVHLNGFYRKTDDYEIPGRAELDHDDDEADHDELEQPGTLENSFLDNEGAAAGASWVGQTWRAGASYTHYKSNYGIPGAHGEHHDEDEIESDDHGHESDEERVTIGLESNRADAELVGTMPFAGVEQFKLVYAGTDYDHTEFEGAEIGTVFRNNTKDGRLEIRHSPWQKWNGAFGAQFTDRDFSAEGEEAFVPTSNTQTAAIFWIESIQFDQLQLDVGVRYEDVKVTAQSPESFLFSHSSANAKKSYNPFSVSAGVIWHLNDGSHFAFNASLAERAPTDQELFALGPHIATQTFEVGDSQLGTETNRHLEGSYRIHQGRLTGAITVYVDYFKDYIFQRDTGEEADELPIRFWSQQDADFIGAEIELRYDIGRLASGHWQATGFGDVVRGKLDDNTNIPRMPPKRIGLGLDWDRGSWAANVSWIHAWKQSRTAEFETETPSYDLLNAEMSYKIPVNTRAEWSLFLKGHNLLDSEIRNSTSHLKDQAPQIGRNFIFGMRVTL